MSVVTELLAAIEAAPEDPDPQLVLADLLLAAGDPRGELIVLDHRDRSTPGGLTDPDALERTLLLAAVYGFPCARDELEPMLPFSGGGSFPVQYEVHHEGRHYFVRYRHHSLSVTIDDGAIDSGVDYPDGFPNDPAVLSSGEWTDDEKLVILTILSDAIRAHTPFSEILFPLDDDPLPSHAGAPLRCYALPEEFTAPRGLGPYEYGLAARDYHRWHALWDRLRHRASERNPMACQR